ncbi:HIT family protein [Corynebacterium sp. sy039]|uniref:HIT family protein n=1 Tax=Corynebacterium sp. sy039 TaxID=2599641 RepID=UPI0011B6DA4B|nr:HIT family protein [Corynebacterium sp. sy039]QDZ42011.1 HIT family protein [Corynebacterium sp. sy039]
MSSVFTQIIEGNLPGRFVYRDDTVVAFLTIEPLAYGHVLVVPIAEVDKWTDLPAETWGHLNEVAQKIGKAIIAAFHSDRAGYIIAGFDVAHTHIHVFPTSSMANYDFATAMSADSTDQQLMDEAAQKLRDQLGTDKTGYLLN